MARREFLGSVVETTTTGSLNSTDTSISLTDGSTFPAGSTSPFVIVIDRGTASEEKVLITSRSSNTLTVSQRGYDGTTATTHSSGANVDHVLDATSIQDMNTSINDVTDVISADTANDRLGIGTTSPDDKLHVVGDVTIEVSDDGSAAQPEITLHRGSSSPADADYLGQFKFSGKNDAGQTVNYAKITGKISDVTDTTEDGLIEIATVKAGSQNIGYRLTSTDMKLINGTGLQVDGNVGIGTTSPSEKLHVDGNITVSTGDSANAYEGGSNYWKPQDPNGNSYFDINSGGFYVDSATYHLRNASGVSRLEIDSSGNVGIGTTSPSAELDIRGASSPEIRLQSTDSSDPFLYFGDQDDAVRGGIGFDTSENSLVFRRYNNITAMTLTSAGYLGINDTTPSYQLDVNGTGRFTGALDADTQINLATSIHLTNVDADGSMRVQGDNGYIDIGPKNSSYCHIYTDRASFYFNKTDLYANSTSNKIWHRGDMRGASTSVAMNSSGEGSLSHGLGTTPDFAFIGARTELSNGNDNQLAFPIVSATSTTLNFRAYEIDTSGNGNATVSTIYNATVYIYYFVGNQ